jgi:hypothetical protein
MRKYRIPIESATKEELIHAIRNFGSIRDIHDEISRHIYFYRQTVLIQKMDECTDESEKICQKSGWMSDQINLKRWKELHKKWDKYNKQLAKLQDQDNE